MICEVDGFRVCECDGCGDTVASWDGWWAYRWAVLGPVPKSDGTGGDGYACFCSASCLGMWADRDGGALFGNDFGERPGDEFVPYPF